LRWKQFKKIGRKASGHMQPFFIDCPRVSEPDFGCSTFLEKLIFILPFFKQRRAMFCTAKGKSPPKPPLLNGAANRPNSTVLFKKQTETSKMSKV
jgi:hypothetical protein